MAEARKPIIAGNWKMNHTHLDAIQVVQKLDYQLRAEDYRAVEVVVCPAFTALRSIQTLIDGDKLEIKLGAQNLWHDDSGAFTGEVSGPMLAKLNVEYVIVGHSERRQIFGETDELVNKKVKAVYRNGMTPILCVGETLEERDGGQTEDKVRAQIKAALQGVGPDHAASLVVAYEPIWAIGTGRNATPDDADVTTGQIRDELRAKYGELADEVRIQYGGSVKPGNIAELMARPNVDGALVGGASLDADEFARVIRYRV